MKKRNEDDPESLGGLGGMLPAEVLKLLNELLERLHQADFTNHGSKIEVVYVASGGQHVETIQTQNVYTTKRQEASKEKDTLVTEQFNDETPLSALFRESHHEELRKTIDSWRPYLTNSATTVDVLNLADFLFDLTTIRPISIYMDLAHLVNHGALRSPMSVLASYMFQHSNLSRSENALYVQLKRYRKMCE